LAVPRTAFDYTTVAFKVGSATFIDIHPFFIVCGLGLQATIGMIERACRRAVFDAHIDVQFASICDDKAQNSR
jgi:hypothetical protein